MPSRPEPPSPPPAPARRSRRSRAVRAVRWVLLALVVWAAVLYLGGSLFALVFVTDFRLTNNSGDDLLVTPIGMAEGDGEYVPLPQFRTASIPLLRVRGLRRELPAGRVIRVVYDADDVNFRHVLVENTRGQVYLMDTDKRGSLRVCYRNQQTEYTVPPLASLPRAPDELLPLLQGKAVHYSRALEYH
jgi:hypothetical protein